jgi:hypothetical protein
VRVVREDPERRGLLYAGTEYGLYVSTDDGRNWRSLQLNLPITPVTDLAVKASDLVVATQGRSYWILDDVTPLRQLTASLPSSRAHLFKPREAVDVEGSGGFSSRGEGKNPPRGVIVYYLLGEDLSAKGKSELKLEILDASGEVLRTLSSQTEEYQAPNEFAKFFPELFEPRTLSAKKGLNRFVWDFRLGDARVLDEAVLWGSPNGPAVPPGPYQARLTLGDWSATEAIQVRPDPRSKASQEDREAAFRLARDAWRGLARAHAAAKKIQSARRQVDDLVARLEAAGQAEGASEAAKGVRAKLTAVEERLWQPKNRASQDILNFPPQLDNQLLYLQNVAESARGKPTAPAVARLAELTAELDGQLAELDRVLATELAAFNELVRSKGAPAVLVPSGGKAPPQR